MSNIDLSFKELESGSIEWYSKAEFEVHLKAIWELDDFKVIKEAHTTYASKIDWGFGLSDVFNKHVQKFDVELRDRILSCIIDISKDPMTPKGDTIKPLEDDKKGLWRYIEGGYRIVYFPDKSKNKVTIMDVNAQRMTIYQKGWFWFLVILALISLDQFIFDYFFKISYFGWYLKNGALIGAAFTLVTLTWDINKNIGLVSANPRHYAFSVGLLIGAQIYSFGAIGKSSQRTPQNDAVRDVIFLDNLVYIIFLILLTLINALWLIMILPIQYFFVLIFGGPARVYLSSPVKALAKFEGNALNPREILRDEEKPEGWMDLSIANKSVTLTYALITLALVVVKYFM